MANDLAAFGGLPVWSERWPAWPRSGHLAPTLLKKVLEGGRWAVSGNWTGEETLDSEFSKKFSEFLGCRHVHTVDHGSSALVIAMLALEVGEGMEVIVPGLTWVACASAVLRVNAVPVLVDICPQTLCLDPAAVEAAITPKTAAILVVHLYSSMADMDRLRQVADKHGIPIIEDCAQAHGAIWDGHRAGSIGDIGTFSMQQGKVMTCGEGGAVCTNDSSLARRLEQLRCDGRMYAETLVQSGHSHLVEYGEVQGFNFCLSEFQSALLLDALDRLDQENQLRAKNAEKLDSMLSEIGGLDPVTPHAKNALRVFYHYPVRFDATDFGMCSAEDMCCALELELGHWVHTTYPPLDNHPLYNPSLARFLPISVRRSIERAANRMPVAHSQWKRTVLFHHPMLLGGRQHIEAIVEAFAKLRRHSHKLSGLSDLKR